MSTITIRDLTHSETYDVIRLFGPRRALISYLGTFVFADLLTDQYGDHWELSGSPASQEETKTLIDLLRAEGSLEDTLVDAIPPGAAGDLTDPSRS